MKEQTIKMRKVLEDKWVAKDGVIRTVNRPSYIVGMTFSNQGLAKYIVELHNINEEFAKRFPDLKPISLKEWH